jgi:hypothetical protein
MLSAPLFTIQEVSELLKVSEATVRSWIKNQELRAVIRTRASGHLAIAAE